MLKPLACWQAGSSPLQVHKHLKRKDWGPVRLLNCDYTELHYFQNTK